MKNIKTLLLGSVAAVGLASAAQAADAPGAAAAASSCVDAYGNGFMEVPGTENCMKIGGYVRMNIDMGFTHGNSDADTDDDAGVAGVDDNNDEVMNWETDARVQFDIRRETELGTLRGVAQINGDGNFGDMFMQLGGLVAGKTGSFFLYEPYWTMSAAGLQDSDRAILGYTMDMGNGMGIGISLEDETAWHKGDQDSRMNMPDAVLRLTVDQSWGGIHAALASHQRELSTVNGTLADESEFGFAASLGGILNIAEGTSFGLRGVYASDAPGFVGLSNDDNVESTSWSALASLKQQLSDEMYVGLTGSYRAFENDEAGDQSETTQMNAALMLDYRPVPDFLIRGEVGYTETEKTKADGTLDEKSDGFGGRIRLQRSF